MFLAFPGASAGPENGLRGEGSANLLITVADEVRYNGGCGRKLR